MVEMKWGNIAAVIICPIVIVSELGPAGVAILLLFGLIWKTSMDVIEENFNKLSNAPLTDRRPDAGSVQGVVESSDMSDLSDKSDGLAT
jgi:hypothetical protein